MKTTINNSYLSNCDGTFPDVALTSGSEESNPANRANLSKLNLSPYSSNLEPFSIDNACLCVARRQGQGTIDN